VDLALTKEQLIQHRLVCKVQPPVTNILTPQESSEVLPLDKDNNTPTKGKGKAKSIVSNESDNKETYKPVQGPPTPAWIPSTSKIVTDLELKVVTAGIKHIAMLKHMDHPKEEVTYQRPHLTNIKLAIQEGLLIPHYPPQMLTLEETQRAKQPKSKTINVTRAGVELIPAVQPANNNDTRGGGKLLISPPKVFTRDQANANDFLQDFKLCWQLNRSYPTMKVLYDQVILVFSYM